MSVDKDHSPQEEMQKLSEVERSMTGVGPGQKQVYQQSVQHNIQQQQTQQQTKYPEPIQGLVDLIGPEQPKGQPISPGQPKLTPQEYKEITKQYTPKPTVLKNCVWAFVVGGMICAIGQVLINFFAGYGLKAEDGGASATSIVMIFIGALLTGLGVYDEIGKRAGAGSIVPITGFANSMVSSALEFKREGFVFGVGAKLFSIAGPVLAYGITTSVIIGLIKFLLK